MPSIKTCNGVSHVATETKSEVQEADLCFDKLAADKVDLPTRLPVNTSRGVLCPIRSCKAFTMAFLAAIVALFWLFTSCLPAHFEQAPEIRSPAATLVEKDSIPPKVPSGLQEVFQVYQPVLTPDGLTDETTSGDGAGDTTTIAPSAVTGSCQTLLMEHSFVNSYGAPFVGQYTPPKCEFNRVSMNFTVTARGRQFDRIALMYFGDTEVWRTSTAEPTRNGIRWEYIKDMSEYMYFWNSPQTLIFDLGNLVNVNLTAPFNTTLTATFFTDQATVKPASMIIPISARNGSNNAPSVFTLPVDTATNTINLPRNANRAVFSVSACGQASEEFWWGNVLQTDIDTFGPDIGTLNGFSPFREVQVLIDGQLAGVHWPFPIIFTGGLAPSLWRPIVGIDAFDLREHEIDITPWLPLLSDGAKHKFEIRVVGIDDDGQHTGKLTETVGNNWLVTGKIFLWLDEDSNSVTTGEAPTMLLPEPTIDLSRTLTQNSTGSNETLTYNVDVKRSLSVSSLVTTQNGSFMSTWTQTLSVTNYGQLTAFGAVQQNNQTTTGLDTSLGAVSYKSSYTYPLYVLTAVKEEASGNFTIDATILRGLDLTVQGPSVFPTGLQSFAHTPGVETLVSGLSGTSLTTTQSGAAHLFGSPSTGVSNASGSTSQEFSFQGVSESGDKTGEELYHRSVAAVDGAVVRDQEILAGSAFGGFEGPASDVETSLVVVGGVKSPKSALGRGSGSPNELLVL